jgi:hypothetical protein
VEEPKFDQTKEDEAKQLLAAEGKVMLTGHMAQLYSNWVATHGKAKAPIALDQNGQAIWLNRAERRARLSAEKKKNR